MFDPKDFVPIEQLGPLVFGALVWGSANYVFFAPEIVMPRAIELKYQPACVLRLADADRQRQELQESLAETAQQKLAEQQERVVRNSKENTRLGLEVMLGKEGAQRLDPFASVITEFALRAELTKRQLETVPSLESSDAAQTLRSNDDTCRCILTNAMDERLDLALYTASLRLYRPPTIMNIETGALFDNTHNCKI